MPPKKAKKIVLKTSPAKQAKKEFEEFYNIIEDTIYEAEESLLFFEEHAPHRNLQICKHRIENLRGEIEYIRERLETEGPSNNLAEQAMYLENHTYEQINRFCF